MKLEDLPKKIPVFPLSNFIIFPKTTVPLNIFEPRYIQMIDDSMKSNRYIGMIQPKKSGDLKNLIYIKLVVLARLQVSMKLKMEISYCFEWSM